jgi:hypothetical protein
MLQTGPVTLRLADADDGAALRRLAELDSRPLPPGPHLIAERNGRIDAALSLSCGRTVADPFRRTAELCLLLRHHAAIRGSAPIRRRTRLRARPILESACTVS